MNQRDHESETVRRHRLRDDNVRDLYELLNRRDELRGVYPMADHVAETFSWAV